jgi:predicted molibdopterin-dependent oxidoreductase YjgC
VRDILGSDKVFVVVNEAFPNETTELADVVLPSALWGEKTGTFTNVDRTVHLSDKAVKPPGQARSDLDIWVDYARRMGFTDRSGRPIPRWDTPEGAFDGWRECSRGRPCDYSGMSYEKLRGSGGIQWPCNDDAPEGTERIYTDHVFNTQDDYCENYGHDLLTGATVTAIEHKAVRYDGRARLKAAPWTPPPEFPSDDYPLGLGTGRTVYHFHTRTKTRRAPELNAAAPDAWVEISPEDAAPLGITEGDLVRVESPRGAIEAKARVSNIRPGAVFVPFHYGDVDRAGGPTRAANELTITAWDPVSKQPAFKGGAVRVTRLAAGDGPSPAPDNTASAPATREG